MSVPTVKLIEISASANGTKPELRLTSAVLTPLAQSSPADLRWSRVEEYLRSRELRPNTRKAYEREFRVFLDWTAKGWQDITARDLDRYKEYLKEQPSKRGGKRSAATINLSLSALQSIFKWLCARDYITKDPMVLIEKPKSDPIQPKEWTLEEVKALFDATTQRGEFETRDRALLWVLLHGLRAREVEALNVSDFDGKRVRIREAKDGSVGTVPLLPEAVKILEAYLRNRKDAGEDLAAESPLFLSESNNSKGQRLSYWGIYKVVKELAAIAGVEDSHPHRGRHTIATEMVKRGMDPLLVMKITRHASPMSLARYGKRGLELKAEEQFLDLFGDGSSFCASKDAAPQRDEIQLPSHTVTVLLKLTIEGQKQAKVKRAIESQVLSRYEMVKQKESGASVESNPLACLGSAPLNC
jgi:integrase/recombinase XerD